MTTLERIGLEIAGGLFALAAVLIWWHVHNLDERKAGAAQCIRTTTEDRTTAKASANADQAAQAVDIGAVVKGYDYKVASLSRTNDDLARQLSERGPLRQGGLPNPRPAAGAKCPDAGLSESEGAAQIRLGRIRADLKAVLDACDANQVKTEDFATIYDDLRARAIKAAAP